MKEIYKNFLFDKHFLVSEVDEVAENTFHTVFSFANLLSIKIVNGKHLATTDLLQFASLRLGKYIPQPFYKGFPDTVRQLTKEELLFDQLVNYTVTYGFGNFDEPRYSIMEKEFERIAFKEETTVKCFDIITEKEAVKVLIEQVENLLSSTRPLSLVQYTIVTSAIEDYSIVVEKCPCKDTAIKYIIDSRKLDFVKFLDLPDFIKVVEFINYYLYRNTNFKKINLKHKDRVFLSKILDVLLDKKTVNFSVCYEKQKAWCGYLHHIHYKPKTKKAEEFVKAMREGKNASAYSLFEKAMAKGDVIGAVNSLIENKGVSAFIRNLNYILSRCKTPEEVAFVIDKTTTKNNVILIQLLLQYANYKREGARNFKFTKFELLKVHTETTSEVKKRKSLIPIEFVEQATATLKENLKNNLKNKLGKVYIGEGMEKIALPIQENTSMGGFGTLPKGSILPLPEGKKIRAFTYWERVNDIDLSLIGIDDKFNQHEFSWRTMYKNQSKGITFSGDEVSGYYGGAEYFDIDLDCLKELHPNIRYYVLCNNVYSGTGFDKCICKAGFMSRDVVDSGEIFEPKTVESSYAINCASNFAYLFAIDVEKREAIWLNTAKDDSSIVAGTTNMTFLLDYFNMTEVINMRSLFTMMATEIVSSSKEADVVVCDQEVEIKDGAMLVRSCDTDKIIPLINK